MVLFFAGLLAAGFGSWAVFNGRVVDVEARASSVEGRTNALDARMSGLEPRTRGLEVRDDALDKRIDDLTTRMTAVESRGHAAMGAEAAFRGEIDGVRKSLGALDALVRQLQSKGAEGNRDVRSNVKRKLTVTLTTYWRGSFGGVCEPPANYLAKFSLVSGGRSLRDLPPVLLTAKGEGIKNEFQVPDSPALVTVIVDPDSVVELQVQGSWSCADGTSGTAQTTSGLPSWTVNDGQWIGGPQSGTVQIVPSTNPGARGSGFELFVAYTAVLE